jgi:D-lyxose ketol-isomerase
MTEKQLIELDFTRTDETAKNSGAPNDFHYYTYELGSFCLITAASYEVENDEWFVDVFESPEIRFTNPTEVSILLTLLTNNYRE